MDEREIIRQLQQQISQHDMVAYRRLFELLAPRLQRFTQYYLHSREAAEEIVSDVFIKLWQQRERLNSVANCQSYMYSMARNMSLNQLDKRGHDPLQHHAEVLPDDLLLQTTPESILISDDMQARVAEAVKALPSQCRLIFTMVREEGLRYQEVADILQLSKRTVRNQVGIAITKLAEALEGYALLVPISKK